MFSNPAVKWALITFGLGMLLIFVEYSLAKRRNAALAKEKGKKVPDPLTWTDKQRMGGMFWISLVISALVGFVVWAS